MNIDDDILGVKKSYLNKNQFKERLKSSTPEMLTIGICLIVIFAIMVGFVYLYDENLKLKDKLSNKTIDLIKYNKSSKKEKYNFAAPLSIVKPEEVPKKHINEMTIMPASIYMSDESYRSRIAISIKNSTKNDCVYIVNHLSDHYYPLMFLDGEINKILLDKNEEIKKGLSNNDSVCNQLNNSKSTTLTLISDKS